MLYLLILISRWTDLFTHSVFEIVGELELRRTAKSTVENWTGLKLQRNFQVIQTEVLFAMTGDSSKILSRLPNRESLTGPQAHVSIHRSLLTRFHSPVMTSFVYKSLHKFGFLLDIVTYTNSVVRFS